MIEPRHKIFLEALDLFCAPLQLSTQEHKHFYAQLTRRGNIRHNTSCLFALCNNQLTTMADPETAAQAPTPTPVAETLATPAAEGADLHLDEVTGERVRLP